MKDQEKEMSETESPTMDSEDDASMTTDNETETEEEEKDPWMPMVEEAMQKRKTAFEEMKMNLMHSGLDEQSAEEKAYSNVLFMLQKELESVYSSASCG